MRAYTIAKISEAVCIMGGLVSLSFGYIFKSTDVSDSSDYLIWMVGGLALMLSAYVIRLKNKRFKRKYKSFYKL